MGFSVTPVLEMGWFSVIIDPTGTRLVRPFDVNLWDVDSETGGPSAIAAPVDPKDFGIDPLTYL